MRTFTFTGSSAIVDNGITVTDNRANIVFKGNREYVYEITDPASFMMQLEGEIADQNGSVGRFSPLYNLSPHSYERKTN
jgi:hypothetical protein